MSATALTCLLAISVVPAFGQTTEQEILAGLQDKPLFLRGFPIEDRLKFNSAGQPGKAYIPGPFTLSGFRAEEVRISGSHLRIDGVRVGLAFDEDAVPHRVVIRTGGLLPKDEKVTIDIATDGTATLPAILKIAFLDGFSELAPVVPEFWQSYVEQLASGDPTPENPKSAGLRKGESPVQAPRLLRSAAPRYTESARRAKISGVVRVLFVCGTDGLPSGLRITKPLGFGLDEAAIAAVIGYRFAPATQDGTPVKADIHVDVNFQII